MERHCVRGLSHVHERSVATVISDSSQPNELQPVRLLCPWDSPGKNTGVGCHALLQWDLSDPGIKPESPALQEDSVPLSHWGGLHGLTILSKAICRFNANPINFQHLCRNRKIHSQSSYAVSRDPK